MKPDMHLIEAPEFDLSVVCVVGRLANDLGAVHRAFADVVSRTGRSAEFLYVLSGPRPDAEAALREADAAGHRTRVYRMAKGFGEAAGLDFAFSRARGRFVITIPDHFQVEPEDLLPVLARLDAGDEVVVTRREPRRDPWINRVQSAVFHRLTRQMAGRRFRDMTCALRGFTNEASRSLDLYGELHRFLPIFAAARGFNVEEIPVRQREEDASARVFGPGVYARRLLDILQVFFLTKFTRKPLRFFGLIGLGVGSIGFLITAVLTAQRLFSQTSLTERPLLLLGVLLLVLGVQIVSIGLIGEIVIFLGSRDHEVPAVELDRKHGD